MADDKLTERIEAWLSGNMPPEEATGFQDEINRNQDLAEEVRLHRLTLQAMTRLSENDLRDKVSGWLEQVPVEYPPEIQPRRNWFWPLLALLLLLLTGAWGFAKWIFSKESADKQEISKLKKQLEQQRQQIFEIRQTPGANQALVDSLRREFEKVQQRIKVLETKKPPPGAAGRPVASADKYYISPRFSALRTTNSDSPQADTLISAINAFNAGDFTLARNLSIRVVAAEPENWTAARLLAHAQFNLRQFVEAQKTFQLIANINAYKYEADWNILLCHKALSTVDAREQELYFEALTRIAANPRHAFQESAKKLLRE